MPHRQLNERQVSMLFQLMAGVALTLYDEQAFVDLSTLTGQGYAVAGMNGTHKITDQGLEVLDLVARGWVPDN